MKTLHTVLLIVSVIAMAACLVSRAYIGAGVMGCVIVLSIMSLMEELES